MSGGVLSGGSVWWGAVWWVRPGRVRLCGVRSGGVLSGGRGAGRSRGASRDARVRGAARVCQVKGSRLRARAGEQSNLCVSREETWRARAASSGCTGAIHRMRAQGAGARLHVSRVCAHLRPRR
eukprot:scaffold39607_cov51-Phaeocystis_antarctica.AAC.2